MRLLLQVCAVFGKRRVKLEARVAVWRWPHCEEGVGL